MRILVASWSASRIGGAEKYLEAMLASLAQRSVEVACIFEKTIPGNDLIKIPNAVKCWNLSTSTANESVAIRREVEDWGPTIVYSQGLASSAVEYWLQSISPSLLFAHNYYGACISGTKTVSRPEIAPCSRVFGFACLALYFPCGCGGRNPLTMLSEFQTQYRRMQQLSRYQRICIASQHMRTELNKYVVPDSTRVLQLPLQRSKVSLAQRSHAMILRLNSFNEMVRPVKLLYVGRIERNKGPQDALRAAPIVAHLLNRDVEITFVGTGSYSTELEKLAASEHVRVRWKGWMSGDDLEEEVARHDLLMIPSIWPEPFGLVGLEAARHGVPAVSYSRGGINEWLKSGETGKTTDIGSSNVDALARAAVCCLQDYQTLCKLSKNAIAFAEAWPCDQHHVDELLELFADVIRQSEVDKS